MHRNHSFQTAKRWLLTASLAAAMSGIVAAQSAANPMNSSSMVSQAQQELKQKGFYSGRVDGIDGPMTRTAVRRYQRAQNLNQTGNLDQATMSSLGFKNMQGQTSGEANRSAEESPAANSTPAENSSGNISQDAVRTAQQKLTDDGFYKGKVDGMMNEGTRAAIRDYQKKNNLPVTGRLNRETAHSLGISTSNQNFENDQTPLEQLGKGIAEGAKTPSGRSSSRHQQKQQ